MAPSVDIIIVNWNSGRLLRDCLESINFAADHDSFKLNRVVVVDNASLDGSTDGLQSQKLPFSIIRNEENKGFAKACNQGAEGSCADYLLFLNPDTYLNRDSLAKPIVFMEKDFNRHIGITGIQLLDGSSEIARTCARFPTPGRFLSKMLGLDRLFPRAFPSHFMSEWDHQESREVDHVMGAFFLIRRFIFEELGGFDEQFFVYLEDLDFSFRARQAGWHCFYLADAKARHKGGGTSERVKAMRLFYSLQSRILYGYKHFGWWSATGLMLGTLLLEPLARLTLSASRRSYGEIYETIKGYSILWGKLPLLLKSISEHGNA
jgi:N-acetylglucosaminyl-diphospho-decaprenol L-rhamnosyltransferase